MSLQCKSGGSSASSPRLLAPGHPLGQPYLWAAGPPAAPGAGTCWRQQYRGRGELHHSALSTVSHADPTANAPAPRALEMRLGHLSHWKVTSKPRNKDPLALVVLFIRKVGIVLTAPRYALSGALPEITQSVKAVYPTEAGQDLQKAFRKATIRCHYCLPSTRWE